MATLILTDQKLFFGEYDLTGDTNSIAVEYGAELKDDTTFGHDTRSNLPGLKTVMAAAVGLVDIANTDVPMFAKLGVENTPVSVAAEGSTVGDVAYFFKAVASDYQFGEAVGEINKFNLTCVSREVPLVRGHVLHDGAETATDNEDSFQVGAASATQSVYAVLHVISSSGTGDQTLDVVVASDDNSGHTSETTRFTFTQATTAATSQFMVLAGAVTDDYYRVKFTIAGSGSPSFTFAVFLGVI